MKQRSRRISRQLLSLLLAVALLLFGSAAPVAARSATALSVHEPVGAGYWLAQGDGAVVSYGDAPDLPGPPHRSARTVAIAATPDGHGYLLADTVGDVFAFGSAHFLGSMAGHRLNSPIVGIAYTPTGNGYYLVAADGGVFTFGDARYRGSMGGQHLNAPIVAMAVTPTGSGYWLAATDGGIFTFGDARFRGSAAGRPLSAPVSSVAATTTGQGYWLLGRDGGVFAYGDAPFYGSIPVAPSDDAVTIARSTSGRGYLIAFKNGSVVGFGDGLSCSEFLDLPSEIQGSQQSQAPLPGAVLLPSGETPDTIGLALPVDPTVARSSLASTCHGVSPAFAASAPWRIDFEVSQSIFTPECDVFLLSAKPDARGDFETLDGWQVGTSGRLQVRSTQMGGQHRFRISLIGSCYAVAREGTGGVQPLPFRFTGGGDSLPFDGSTVVTVEANGPDCDLTVFNNHSGRPVVSHVRDHVRLSLPAGSYYLRSNRGCDANVH